MLMMFDPVYFMFILPGVLFAMWAQWKVKSAYREASQIAPRSGYNGRETAYEVMRAADVQGVDVETTPGELSDHYSPSEKVLRLSPDVYEGRSLAALGISAHEVGHAIQDARGYGPLVLRNALVPMANFGSSASWFIIMIGFVLSAMRVPFGPTIVYVGCGAFSMVVLFQLVNLPVEFDASRRAKIALVEGGLITEAEKPYVDKVLNAAAMTYVAGTLTSILTLLYFLYRAGLLGGRNE